MSTLSHVDERFCQYGPYPESGDVVGWDLWHRKHGITMDRQRENTHRFEALPIEVIRNNRCPVCGWSNPIATAPESKAQHWGYWFYTKYVNAFTGVAGRYLPADAIPPNCRSPDMHVDHIFSIAHAFQLGLPEQVVGSPVNIRYLSASENSSKGARCDQTVEQLLTRYGEFSAAHPEWEALVPYVEQHGDFPRVPRSPPPKVTAEQRIARVTEACQVVQPLWERGLGINSIADRLGWSRQTLINRLKRHRDLVADSFVLRAGENQRLPN